MVLIFIIWIRYILMPFFKQVPREKIPEKHIKNFWKAIKKSGLAEKIY